MNLGKMTKIIISMNFQELRDLIIGCHLVFATKLSNFHNLKIDKGFKNPMKEYEFFKMLLFETYYRERDPSL